MIFHHGLSSFCILMIVSIISSVPVTSSNYDLCDSAKNKNMIGFLRVCYYTFGDPEPSQINGTLCTHIIQGFTSVVNGVLDPGTMEDVERYIETAKLKTAYPHLKVMISIGGGGNAAGFSQAVSSPAARMKLIYSVLNFLVTYNYDGLDIDWEFPVWNDAVKEDKHNFIHFLHDFKQISCASHNQFYLLSVAVAAPSNIIQASYDVPAMARSVDFINLMSYDYHDYRFYIPFTGHNSPLFNRSVEKAYFSTLNTAWSSMYWSERGMPMNKIMVGLPTYGHTYKLLLANYHDVDAPSLGYGQGSGTVTLPEICNSLKNGFTRVFDNESKVPYIYKDTDWFSYEDIESITNKVKWVKSMGFGGVMTFDLNCDDWKGICNGKTKFPLHQVIYAILSKT